MKAVSLQIFVTILISVQAVYYLKIQRLSNRTFSTSTEICCQGTIYEGKNSSNYECCGTKLIEKTTEICCYPDAHPRQLNFECCGNKICNTRTHFCHNSMTIGQVRTSSDRLEYPVIFPLFTNVHSTCGDKIMDDDVEICCNFNVIPDRDKKFQCCHDVSYDPNTQVCCTNDTQRMVLANISPDNEDCCSGKPFNYRTEICLNGTLMDKPSAPVAQCGYYLLYNVLEEVCCFNPFRILKKLDPIHYKCCGDITFDYDTSVCCTDVNESMLYTSVEAENKICCGVKLANEDQKCCGSRHPYDPKTQTCCEIWKDMSETGRVHEGAGRECCGLDVIDNTEEECCGTTIISKSPIGQSGRCSYTINDIKSESVAPVQNMRFFRSL